MQGGNFCAECGSRLSERFAPCDRCGNGESTTLRPAVVYPQPWEAPTSARSTTRPDRPEKETTDPGSARRRTGRRPLVLVPVVLLLALAAVAGGLLVGLGVFGEDDGTDRASASDRAERGDGRDERGRRKAVDGPEKLPFTCWTGNPAVAERACPAGPNETREGFSWIFPRVDFDRCGRSAPTGRVMRSCEIDGVRFNFSLWDSVEAARANYVSNFGVQPEPRSAGRVLWDGVGANFGEGEYKSAVMYADHPWSMTVYATSEEAASAAVYRYWMRAAGELRGSENP